MRRRTNGMRVGESKACRTVHRNWWVGLTLALVGIVLTLAHRLDADEGQILTGAWNLYTGRTLYEDFFEFIGPASFEWVHGFFAAFGPSYASALAASQVLLLASLWAFHAIGNRIMVRKTPVVLASLLWLVLATLPPFINHNSFSSFLALGFAWCVLTALSGRGRWPAFGGGALAAATFFFLQPKGLALLGLGLLASPWFGSKHVRRHEARSSVHHEALFFGAGALVVLGIGFRLWGIAPVTSVLTVAKGNLAMNEMALSSYVPLIVAVGLLALVVAATYREGVLDRSSTFLLLLQAGLWASTLHLPDPWHLAINSFPLLLVLGRLADRVLERGCPRRWRLGLATLFVVVFGSAVVRSLTRNVEETRATRAWIRELDALLGDDTFFAFTFLPSFYLELKIPDPYYNSVLYTSSHPPQHFRRNVAILSEQQPRFVLVDYSSVAKYGHTLENPVDIYIRSHYRPVRWLPYEGGRVEVWEHR